MTPFSSAFSSERKRGTFYFLACDGTLALLGPPRKAQKSRMTPFLYAEILRLEHGANRDLGFSRHGVGQRLTQSIASCIDFTCHNQKPSVKGGHSNFFGV
jgi:hypothetical protein